MNRPRFAPNRQPQQFIGLVIALACLMALAVHVASAASAQSQTPAAVGYMDFAALTKAVQDLAAASPSLVKAEVIGASRQGRGLHLLILAADQAHAHSKPAVLITAGLDPRHRVGIETAIRIARRVVADHPALLNDATIYIVPCLNPDGLELNAGTVNLGLASTLRVVDDDRDGAAYEDPPVDLNGDGYITMMRRLDPPLDDVATHLPNPAAPRTLKEPNKEKGERAIYSIYTEGLDADGDGKVAEDGPGGVDLEHNFMHRWPEHEPGAGPYPLSEPESAALAKFVLDHRNIVIAINYGRHDNLINVPDGKGTDRGGQGPKDLDGDDVEYYKELSKLFKDLTAQQRAPGGDTAGALHSWLYAQRGIPSFATVVWGRPDRSKPVDPQSAPATQTSPTTQTQPDAQTQPEAQPQPEPHAESQPASTAPSTDAKPQAPEGERAKDKKDEPKPADAEAAAWLEYSDRDRGKAGFVEWQPFDHPSLGKVEIGGFVPGFQMNPPSDQLDALAEKQTSFIVELVNRRPKLSVQGPSIKKLATGLYEVRFGIVNEGYLPTATAIARKARSVLPTVIRVSVPIE